MRILLGGVLGGDAAIEVSSEAWVSPQPDFGKTGQDDAASAWEDELRDALASPRGFPALAQSAFPGDRVVLTLDPETPQAEVIAARIATEILATGVSPAELRVLIAPGASDEFVDHLGRRVARLSDDIAVLRHDPADRAWLGYLAADAEERPIYLRREILDADLVVSIGVARLAGPVPDASADGGLFPTFSDEATIVRFHERTRKGNLAALRKEVRETNWLLGSQFAVRAVPASGDEVGRIVAGEMGAVLTESDAATTAIWSMDSPDPAGVAVACLSGPLEQQNWENFGRALSAAAACTKEGGAIVLLTGIGYPPRIDAESTPSDRDEVEDLDSEELYREEAEAASRVPSWRRVLDEYRSRHGVYLASRLPDEAVEALGCVPLSTAAELRRLLDRFGDCVWIRDGQYVAWSTELAVDRPAKRRRKKKT